MTDQPLDEEIIFGDTEADDAFDAEDEDEEAE